MDIYKRYVFLDILTGTKNVKPWYLCGESSSMEDVTKFIMNDVALIGVNFDADAKTPGQIKFFKKGGMCEIEYRWI